MYSHFGWAEARARNVTHAPYQRDRSPNDSGYEDAVAGPSGYRPKTEIKDEIFITEDMPSTPLDSSEDVSQEKCRSVKIFDLSDDDSLPDLSQCLKDTKPESHFPDKTELDSAGIPDIDFYSVGEIKGEDAKSCHQNSHVSEDSLSWKNASELKPTSPCNSDTFCDIVENPDRIENINSEDVGAVSVISDSSETVLFEEDKSDDVQADDRALTACESDKNVNCVNSVDGNSDLTRSSDQSKSLLRHVEQFSDTATVAEVSRRDSKFREVALPQPITDEEDEDDAVNNELDKLVDEAVDKYIGKAQKDAKCFHLHIHYDGTQKSSPQKKSGMYSASSYPKATLCFYMFEIHPLSRKFRD